MPDLARREAAAQQRLAAGDEAGSDALADLDEHEVGFRIAEGVLGEHRRVGVVACEHWQVEIDAELRLEREVRPAEVGRAEDEAVRAHDTRGADTHAEQRLGGCGDQGLRELPEGCVRRLAVGRLRTRHRTSFEHVAVEAQHRAGEGVGSGEVETDDLVTEPVDVDEDGRLARADGLAHAHLDDDPIGDELGDQVGDGDPGEPRLPGEVGERLIAPAWYRVCRTRARL